MTWADANKQRSPSDLRKLWPTMRSNSLRDGAAWLVEQFNRVLAKKSRQFLQGAARLADIAENTAGIWELHERALVTKPVPNFTRLDPGRPDIAILMNAMLRAREVAAARLMSLTILVSCSKCPWQAAVSRARYRE